MLLANAFKKAKPTGTSGTLRQKRTKACEEIGERIIDNLEVLRVAASRLLILERVTVEEMRRRWKTEFERRALPTANFNDVIRAFHDEIKSAKRKTTNAIPGLVKVLEALKDRSISPKGYSLRGDEAQWERQLADAHILLLSGRPRCGKSDSARYLAARFQSRGFDAREGSTAEDADRYLRDAVLEPRIYVLHDPLGATRRSPEARQQIGLIRSLIQQLGENRKLIIAQNQEQLFETIRIQELAACAIGGKQWNDVSSSTPQFLAQAWEDMAIENRVKPAVRHRLADALLSGKVDLEPGCLRHLVGCP